MRQTKPPATLRQGTESRDSPKTTPIQQLTSLTLDNSGWLMFPPPEKSSEEGQRWRLLMWALVVSLLWSYTGHNSTVFASLILCLAATSVLSARYSTPTSAKQTRNYWVFPVSLLLLSSAYVTSGSLSAAILGRLVQKLALKEYGLLRHWCPDTHVTIFSVVIITCVVQGVPHFLTRPTMRSRSRSLGRAPTSQDSESTETVAENCL